MVKVAKGVGSLEAATKTTGTLCSWNKFKFLVGRLYQQVGGCGLAEYRGVRSKSSMLIRPSINPAPYAGFCGSGFTREEGNAVPGTGFAGVRG
jgi:hypothetical protein